jgi:hypothetical protein
MSLYQWAEVWVERIATKIAPFTQFHKRKRHDIQTCDVDGLLYSRSFSSAIRATQQWCTTRYLVFRAFPDGIEEPHHLIIGKICCPLSWGFKFVSFALCVNVCVCVCVYVCARAWLPFFSLLPYLIILLSIHTFDNSLVPRLIISGI